MRKGPGPPRPGGGPQSLLDLAHGIQSNETWFDSAQPGTSNKGAVVTVDDELDKYYHEELMEKLVNIKGVSIVKTKKILMPEKIAVIKHIILGFYHKEMCSKDGVRIADVVDSNQSDLGLHCLPRPVCPKTKHHHVKTLLFF